MRLIDADALKEKMFIADDNWNPVVTEIEIDEEYKRIVIPIEPIKDFSNITQIYIKHNGYLKGIVYKKSKFEDRKCRVCRP